MYYNTKFMEILYKVLNAEIIKNLVREKRYIIIKQKMNA